VYQSSVLENLRKGNGTPSWTKRISLQVREKDFHRSPKNQYPNLKKSEKIPTDEHLEKVLWA